MDQEAGRKEEFFSKLKGVEYLAARLSDNPNLCSGTGKNLMHWKSIELMTAMVKFFNSALLYFSRDWFGNCSSF